MSLTLRTALGCTEAVIDGDGGLKRFYQIAGILTDHLKVAFINKEDDFDAISAAAILGREHFVPQTAGGDSSREDE